jgi:primosomal protein N' (replication factor Y)
LEQFFYIKEQYQSEIKLTKVQNDAYQQLSNPENKNIVLLEGETGSGKTMVYLEKVKEILSRDGSAQILILLPEIALTNAILDRVEKYLGIQPIAWHSNITTKDKKENFLATIFNTTRVVVGARSAIFLPFHNLKLIIIDEEHDNSFKQDQQILYQTTEIAKIILHYNKNLQIILSSATPSLETIYNVKTKNYTRILLKSDKTLNERMQLKIEDMNKNENKGNLVSNAIIKKIQFYLDRNLQSMIFLNKRGYNSVIICEKCNNKLLCKNCSTGMIFHKELNKIFCTCCNFSLKPVNAKCTSCFSEKQFKFYGFGIEKIYELLAIQFPNLATNNRILLLSGDNNQNLQEKIKKIENGEIDIVVGTQILAKGHNFPRLAFLGIIDGGLNFSGIDLRASEKTYQILHQIIGRLGRFQIEGEVITQTFEPNNIILKALIEQNRTKFYTYEFQQRQDFLMPPFSQLFKITFSNTNQEKALKDATKFINTLDYQPEIEIIGPAPSSIIKMNKKYHYNILIKTKHGINLQEFLYNQFLKHKINQMMFRIDISPSNFI